MPKLRNGSKGDSNPGSLDCESGILPLSYRAPHSVIADQNELKEAIGLTDKHSNGQTDNKHTNRQTNIEKSQYMLRQETQQ